jgi:hypothetical protein
LQAGEVGDWEIQKVLKITVQRVLGLPATLSIWESATRGKLSEGGGLTGQSSLAEKQQKNTQRSVTST